MKSVSIVALVASLTLGLLPARGDDKKADTASELKALDAKLTEAFKTRDLTTLAKHIEDGYMLIDPRGETHGKKKYLKHLADGTAKFKELSETDVKVRVFGDTGVVSGLLHVKGMVEDKEVSAEYRWTRVYAKHGDEWHCVLEQHTHVHPKEKEKDK